LANITLCGRTAIPVFHVLLANLDAWEIGFLIHLLSQMKHPVAGLGVQMNRSGSQTIFVVLPAPMQPFNVGETLKDAVGKKSIFFFPGPRDPPSLSISKRSLFPCRYWDLDIKGRPDTAAIKAWFKQKSGSQTVARPLGPGQLGEWP